MSIDEWVRRWMVQWRKIAPENWHQFGEERAALYYAENKSPEEDARDTFNWSEGWP